jgi:hypothetical protein
VAAHVVRESGDSVMVVRAEKERACKVDMVVISTGGGGARECGDIDTKMGFRV